MLHRRGSFLVHSRWSRFARITVRRRRNARRLNDVGAGLETLRWWAKSKRLASGAVRLIGGIGRGTACHTEWGGRCPAWHKILISIALFLNLAGVEGLEPPTPGFGDRCSSRLSYTPAVTARRRGSHAASRPRMQAPGLARAHFRVEDERRVQPPAHFGVRNCRPRAASRRDGSATSRKCRRRRRPAAPCQS